MHRIYLQFFAFLFLVACSGSSDKPNQQQPEELYVDAVVAKDERYASHLKVSGTLLPFEQTEIRAPISGTVLSYSFKEGQYIRKGQKMVQLDDRDWREELKGLEVRIKNVSRDLERKKTLLDAGGASQGAIDEANSLLNELKARRGSLRVKIDLAEVKAPFSGKVGLRNFSKGAFMAEGGLITTLTTSGKLKLEFNLPATYAGTVKVGDSVLVLTASEELSATIYAVNPAIDESTRTVKIRALLYDAMELVAGDFVQVLYTTHVDSSTILVPTSAVVPELNQQNVYIIKNNKAQKRAVQLGERNDKRVQIEDGLMAGDTVIISGLLQVENGKKVKASIKEQSL